MSLSPLTLTVDLNINDIAKFQIRKDKFFQIMVIVGKCLPVFLSLSMTMKKSNSNNIFDWILCQSSC